MKTAISITDDIFIQAEQTARQLGLSRSRLYTMAIKEFVENHNPDAVTEKLNQVYSNNNSKLDEDLLLANYDLLSRDEW